MSVKIQGGSSTTGLANVDANYNLKINSPGYLSDGTSSGGGNDNAGAVIILSENDTGEKWGVRDVQPPEADDDYRLRVAMDNIMDQECFNYTSGQNTGKHRYDFITMTTAATANGFQTNSSSITTVTTGVGLNTWAEFPYLQNQTLVCEQTVAFSAQPVTNTTIDIGFMRRATSNPFAPTDGVYFRLTSAGLFGVVNYNGSELPVQCKDTRGTANWSYTNSVYYKLLIQVTNIRATFWVDNVLVASIPTPSANTAIFKSSTIPWGFRHAIAGSGASGVLQMFVSDYKVGIRGEEYSEMLGTIMNRALGSYQGLSGGTMGQLVAGTVTSGSLVKPTAAIPANTSLVANLPNSLGGRIYEQLSSGLAASVDGVFASYTVPAGSTTVQGRRLKVTGLKLSGFVSTVVAGGTANQIEWYIAFGHTADSLATAETASFANATTKAPRRVMLPELTTTMTLTQAANTLLVQPAYSVTFQNPIYVNPGERIALVGNKTGTVPTSGVLSYVYQFDYSWE